jgi:predicted metal-binding membrane protein
MTALRRVRWHHPELEAVVGAGGAWLLLLAPVVGGETVSAIHDRAHASVPLLAGALAWLLMVIAMMIPTTLAAARYVGLTALWRRRRLTVVEFLAAYVAAWGAFGAIALPVAAIAPHALGTSEESVLAGVLAVAAAWELTPWKWRSVRSCHRHEPLPPAGRRAHAACIASGIRYGARCMGACWPAMAAMAVAGHARLGLMALLTVVLTAEKLSLQPARLARPAAGMLAGTVLVTLAA